MLATDKSGFLSYKVRRGDVDWSSWIPFPDVRTGFFKARDAAIAQMPNGNAEIAAYDQDGALRIAAVSADGTTRGAWVNVAQPFQGKRLAMTATMEGVLQIAATDVSDRVHWTTLTPRGTTGAWKCHRTGRRVTRCRPPQWLSPRLRTGPRNR